MSQNQPQFEEEASPTSPSHQISLGMRPITTGRRILFEYLKEIGFVIGDFIENQGWKNLCSLDVKIYPNLVRMFYENLRFGENFIESFVKGRRIIISAEILGSVLEMPLKGQNL